MRLKKISTSGCDRVADGSYELGAASAAPAELVVVTGGIASGKTSLLELIIAAKEGAGAYGAPRFLDTWRRPGEAAAKIIAEWWLDERELGEVGGASVRVHETIIDPARPRDAELDPDDGLMLVLSRLDALLPKVEYFHAGRRIPPPAAFIGSGTLDGERHYRLESSDQKYATLHAYLVELALGMHEPDGLPNMPGSRAIRFDDMLRDLTDSVAFAGSTRGSSPVPLFVRKDGSRRTLSELSHVERQAILLAGTCVRSGLERGVALLDTPEQMGSVARAVDTVRVLAKYTPGCQWIVATGPEVAAKLAATRTIEMKG